jgi:hypothetical protein
VISILLEAIYPKNSKLLRRGYFDAKVLGIGFKTNDMRKFKHRSFYPRSFENIEYEMRS